MAFSRESLVGLAGSFLPDVETAVRRFPLAALIVVVFTALNLFYVNGALELDRDAWMRMSFGLGTGFLWSISLALHAERRNWTNGLRIIAELSGFSVIAAFYTLQIAFSFQPHLFFIALAILVGLAPYLWFFPASNASFWHFNHTLWLGAAFALFGAVLFSGGLSVIVAALELLFDLKLPNDTPEYIWIVGLGLIAPLNWLSLIPVDFAAQVPEGEQEEFTSRTVAIIVKYVLVPLLLVYTAILYAYAVKIGIEGVFPKGRVGPMVLGYGLLGTLTVLFAWPSRNVGGSLVTLFWRHWFWLMIGPVALLFLAAYQRIEQYGVTIDRYLVVLAGIWLCAMVIWFLARRGARDIRFIPLSLCVLLLTASFGPWGAVGWSVRDQMAELVKLLEASGRMKVGQIILTSEMGPLPDDKARRVSSILWYLQRRKRLEDLKPWFETEQANPFSDRLAQYQIRREIARLIGVPKNLLHIHEIKRFYFAARQPSLISLPAFDEILGPVEIFKVKPNVSLGADSGTLMDADIKKNIVTFNFMSGLDLKFDVTDAVQLAAELSERRPVPKSAEYPGTPLKVQAQNNAGSVMLIVNMRGYAGKADMTVETMEVWLLLKRQ